MLSHGQRSSIHEQLWDIRRTFMKNVHLRFMKEFFYHEPYGKRELYKQRVETATLEKLAKLIHVTALLLQTKVYLFWKKNNGKRRELLCTYAHRTIAIFF